ncbi:hypothetical protein RRG08_049600 [Elysia crispata]|uniref:Uncharacterized protein n=1 Tax=Elysia crispata TaxID=231223 RepID=A0AAE1AUV6_9GAST|nr:hypothetical protein RRG08_049600 [Elysia crispata]
MATVGENIQISTHTIDKVTKAKVTLENYYTNLVSQNDEREGRYRLLERSMDEEGLTDEQVCLVILNSLPYRFGLKKKTVDDHPRPKITGARVERKRPRCQKTCRTS